MTTTTHLWRAFLDGRAALATRAEPETFLLEALRLLEREHRAAVLLLLAAWEQVDVPAPELFSSLVAMQRPSWGSWNGLAEGVLRARREVLRSGAPEARRRVEASEALASWVERFDRKLDEREGLRLAGLAGLAHRELSGRLRIRTALSLPIAVRNELMHGDPDARYREEAVSAVRTFLEASAAWHPLASGPEQALPQPWFSRPEDELAVFGGLERDGARLIGSAGGARLDGAAAAEVVNRIRRLCGRQAESAEAFARAIEDAAPSELQGILLDDFLVGREVGAGGYGTVHLARQLSTGRQVAIKLLHDGLDEDARHRFRQEARYLARVEHPGVVEVIAQGEAIWRAPREGLPREPWAERLSHGARSKHYIALEWVGGATLEEVFRRGARPDDRTLARWFTEAADALAAVHAAGLIHRDVKPSNLMLTAEGRVKLMDLGIARLDAGDRSLMTATGVLLGTPAYMSPEQLRARAEESAVGPRSDVYSLAATFYELFTGTRIFDHDVAPAVTVEQRKLAGDRPDRPRQRARVLDWELDAILLGGLEPEPVDRYATAAALAADLRRYLADEPITYRRPSVFRRARLGYRRNRALANAAAVVLVLATVGGVAYVQQIARERRRTEAELVARRHALAVTLLSTDPARAISVEGANLTTSSAGVTPASIQLLRYWGPMLVPAAEALEDVHAPGVFTWRGKSYVRLPGRAPMLLPSREEVEWYLFEGDTLFTVGGNTLELWNARNPVQSRAVGMSGGSWKMWRLAGGRLLLLDHIPKTRYSARFIVLDPAREEPVLYAERGNDEDLWSVAPGDTRIAFTAMSGPCERRGKTIIVLDVRGAHAECSDSRDFLDWRPSGRPWDPAIAGAPSPVEEVVGLTPAALQFPAVRLEAARWRPLARRDVSDLGGAENARLRLAAALLAIADEDALSHAEAARRLAAAQAGPACGFWRGPSWEPDLDPAPEKDPFGLGRTTAVVCSGPHGLFTLLPDSGTAGTTLLIGCAPFRSPVQERGNERDAWCTSADATSWLDYPATFALNPAMGLAVFFSYGSGDEERPVDVLDVPTMRRASFSGANLRTWAAAFDPSRSRVALLGPGLLRVARYDRGRQLLEVTSSVRVDVLTPDVPDEGETALMSSKVLDAEAGLEGPMAFVGEHHIVLASGSDLSLVDVRTGAVVWTQPAGAFASRVSVSPDEDVIAAWSSHGVQLFSAFDGAPLTSRLAPPAPPDESVGADEAEAPANGPPATGAADDGTAMVQEGIVFVVVQRSGEVVVLTSKDRFFRRTVPAPNELSALRAFSPHTGYVESGNQTTRVEDLPVGGGSAGSMPSLPTTAAGSGAGLR